MLFFIRSCQHHFKRIRTIPMFFACVAVGNLVVQQGLILGELLTTFFGYLSIALMCAALLLLVRHSAGIYGMMIVCILLHFIMGGILVDLTKFAPALRPLSYLFLSTHYLNASCAPINGGFLALLGIDLTLVGCVVVGSTRLRKV